MFLKSIDWGRTRIHTVEVRDSFYAFPGDIGEFVGSDLTVLPIGWLCLRDPL